MGGTKSRLRLRGPEAPRAIVPLGPAAIICMAPIERDPGGAKGRPAVADGLGAARGPLLTPTRHIDRLLRPGTASEQRNGPPLEIHIPPRPGRTAQLLKKHILISRHSSCLTNSRSSFNTCCVTRKTQHLFDNFLLATENGCLRRYDVRCAERGDELVHVFSWRHASGASSRRRVRS